MKAIVSNNCWGAGYYQAVGSRFNTPFIGLFLYADDYIKLLRNFREYMSSEIRHIDRSRRGEFDCPVGVIGDDIEIQFLHYASFDDAQMKWERRKLRLPEDDDQLIFKMCDRDGFDESHLRAFIDLDFRNKICIVKKDKYSILGRSHVYEFETDDDCCPSGPELWNGTSHLIDAVTKE